MKLKDLREMHADLPKKPGRKVSKVPDEVIFDLFNRSTLTLKEIGDLVGLHPDSVGRRLRQMGINDVGKKIVEKFRENRKDILAEGQRVILETHLTPQKIRKMEPQDARLFFDTLYKAERLEQGKSTSNAEVHHHVLESVLRRRLECHTSKTSTTSE